MNTAMAQKSPGRIGDLNPFCITIPVGEETRRIKNADGRDAPRVRAETEYGCVDWYQYRANVREEKTAH
jgi:hypothetical protein